MQAKYTVVLKSLMDNAEARSELEKALSTYPLYVQKTAEPHNIIPTRAELNEKILNAYKYREIGFETVGRFVDELEITMNEIMPYYNELFSTVEIMATIEDPFGNLDVTETYDEERTDNATGTQNATSTNTASSDSSTSGTSQGTEEKTVKNSDTPQNEISNINTYLTNYSEEKNDVSQTNSETSNISQDSETISTSSGTTEASGTVRHTLHRKGNQGVNTYAHDMNEFRTSIINVVQQIINDERLSELFLRVY